MANEPLWTRAYLRNLGQKDEDIGYENGAVTLKKKPLLYTAPNAEGKAMASQGDLDSAYNAYQGRDAIEQYKKNIEKPPVPFSYDMNSIKADPLYSSALGSYTQDANRGTDQALVNLGRRGIGNSSSAVQAELSGQQSINNFANTKLAPQVIAQKYQQYLDANAQQEKQNQNILGLANRYDDQSNSDRIFNAGRQDAATNATGYYNPSGMDAGQINQEIAKNSAAWANASPEQQKQLHTRNVELNGLLGKTDTTGSGDYAGGNPNGMVGQRTVTGQQVDFNQGMQTKQFDRGNFESDRSYELAKSGQEWGQMMQKETFDFNKAQTIWENGFKESSFQKSMEDAAQNRGMQWANLNQRDKEFVADQAFKEKNFSYQKAQDNISRDLEIFSKTGKAPESLAQYGVDTKSLNNPSMKADLTAMYQGFATEQIKPKDALKMIEDKVKIGAEDPENGEVMRQAIFKLYPELDPTQKGEVNENKNTFFQGFKKIFGLYDRDKYTIDAQGRKVPIN